MKIPFAYGAAMAVCGLALTLVQYLLGFHSEIAKFGTAQRVGLFGGILIMVGGIIAAMIAVRAKSPDHSLSYGKAVGTGTLTCLFSGLFSAIFTYIYGAVINPEFHELLYQTATRELSAEQVEAASKMLHFFTGPIWSASMAFVMSPIIGALASLVLALFFKRNPTPPPVQAA